MEAPQRDTELFIMAVRNWECLWRNGEGWTMAAKNSAWEKIGKRFHSDWQFLSPSKREQYIYRMKKQWYSLKFHYNEYKRKLHSGDCPKKRKPNHFEALSFLDVNLQGSDEASTSIEETMTPDITPDGREVLPLAARRKLRVSSAISNNTVNRTSTERKENITQENRNVIESKPLNANEHFLFSILPDLDKMNARQVTDFKIGVMTLIRDMTSDDPAEANTVQGPSKECESTSNDGENINKVSTSNESETPVRVTPKPKPKPRRPAAPTMTRDSMPAPTTPSTAQTPPTNTAPVSTEYSVQYRTPQGIWQNLLSTALHQQNSQGNRNEHREQEYVIELDDDTIM